MNQKSEHKNHVFEGKPDDRQADANIPVSRFRPRYRALTDAEKALHDAIKNKATELETLFEKVCPGRYRSIAFTSLEESVMWVIKELTGNGMMSPGDGKIEQKAT